MHLLTERNDQHIKQCWFAKVSNLQAENEKKGIEDITITLGMYFFRAKNALLE